MYSLWRAGVMLGRITPELPNEAPSAVVGILQPTDAFAPNLAVMQRTMDGLPGSPVWQHQSPRSTDSDSSDLGSGSVRPESCRRLSSEAYLLSNSCNCAMILARQIPTHSITVMEMRLGNRDGMDTLCAAAGVTFSGWYVTAGLAALSDRAR